MSLARVKTWIASETLTASDLNAEFNNILNYLNGAGVTLNAPVLSGITTIPGGGQISAGGLLGLGMTPINILDITQTQNNTSIMKILNGSAGAAAQALIQASNGTSIGQFYVNGTGFTPANIDRADGMVVKGAGAGGLTIATGAAQPIYIAINNVGIAQFDASGNLVVGATSALARFRADQSSASSDSAYFSNSHASPGAVAIVDSIFTAAAPNTTTSFFLYCNDNAAIRAQIRSNGGLANFSANNVNLSDARVKPEFELHTDNDLAALEASFIAVDFGKFKYADQTHPDWNYGYTAQGVEAAFAETVPALTDIWNPTKRVTVQRDVEEAATVIVDGIAQEVMQTVAKDIVEVIDTPPEEQLKAVYTEDLNNIAHALLARALKRIAALEAAAGIH